MQSHEQLAWLPPGDVWLDDEGQIIQAHGGGMLIFEGRYYWYGENRDVPPGQGNVKGVSCYSSTDLVHWTHHGVVLPVVHDAPDHDLYFRKVIERPKVIYNARTRQFVMVLHIDSPDYKYARVGFAVSEAPTGPFVYLGSVRPNNSESRDMTVFQDDDGQAYLFYASEGNATMHIAKLSDDYLHVEPDYIRIFENEYREAPAVFKRRGKYFLITSGCSGWEPNAAQYAVADSILGPWEVVGNPCRGPGADKTFGAQGTFVLPVQDRNTWIFMADRWKPKQLWNSRYIWLPIHFLADDRIVIRWEGGAAERTGHGGQENA
ncbi:glycosyl hydrolase family 43 [Alicyclobacillus cellulosilyticus]|uniref:Glycosyl hydrolase family 43 n=1 Tax=Alicyclobacillus cellulosilyticus TaxID=1003997 RepID=A0A917NNW5_9BACL|nr:glycosyl hydrolase family 43 [Alicyclobacillus cellulosilyticus]